VREQFLGYLHAATVKPLKQFFFLSRDCVYTFCSQHTTTRTEKISIPTVLLCRIHCFIPVVLHLWDGQAELASVAGDISRLAEDLVTWSLIH